MGVNKNVEDEIKKDGFIKRNVKKGGSYVKDETVKFSGFNSVKYFHNEILKKSINYLNPFKKREQGREETFEDAMKRQNITEEGLAESFKYYKFYFYLGLSLSFLGLALGVFFILSQGIIWAIGPTIACLAIGVSQMIVGSFRSFQINNRVLCGFDEWKAAGYYIPKKFKEKEILEKEKRKLEKNKLKRLN